MESRLNQAVSVPYRAESLSDSSDSGDVVINMEANQQSGESLTLSVDLPLEVILQIICHLSDVSKARFSQTSKAVAIAMRNTPAERYGMFFEANKIYQTRHQIEIMMPALQNFKAEQEDINPLITFAGRYHSEIILSSTATGGAVTLIGIILLILTFAHNNFTAKEALELSLPAGGLILLGLLSGAVTIVLAKHSKNELDTRNSRIGYTTDTIASLTDEFNNITLQAHNR